MAELGTGKSVVVLAIVVGCFSILWPKIFYPMMQTAFSLTAPKYGAEDGRGCQFILDAETTGYAFFASLCEQMVARETSVHPSLRGRQAAAPEEDGSLPDGLMGRCQTALSAVCRIDLQASLQAQTVEEIEVLEKDRKVKLGLCLLEVSKTKRKRRRFHKRKIVNTWETQSRTPPHLHLPPRMREAMGEARPDLPPFHPSSHQGSPHRSSGGASHLMKDGRPFPHPSARQPPKPQPKTGGAMSIVMPIYTIGIVGFFLYTLLKLLFKKRNEEQSDQHPVIPNYHMDPGYHRYILGNDRPTNNLKQQQQQQQQQQTTTSVPTSGSSKVFVNESKTKRYLEEFGKQKVEVLEDEKDLEILQLKRKLQETEDALQQILDKVSANMNRAVSTPIPTTTTTANDTEVEDQRNYDKNVSEREDHQEDKDSTPDNLKQDDSRVEDIQIPTMKADPQDEELNQKETSSNSSPDTESYELIGSPHEDSGRSESEGSEKATINTNSTTLRQRFVQDTNNSNDDSRNRSYKLSDILQF